MNRIIPTALAAVALALPACSDSSSTDASPDTSAQTTSPPAWLLTDMPADAVSVAELKTSAAEGDLVAIRGRIGGTKSPMTAGSPIFTLVDASVPSCADNPDDHCRTPWDYCCEPRDHLTANSATIQLVDTEGNPLAADPTASLSPLDDIIAVGVVDARPNDGVLIVKATGIYQADG